MSSIWIIIGSAAAFAVAYRYYGAFLAARVAVLDDRRPTPAHRLNDGVDYHPTNRWVLFGHHFAAIAGPGPLLGPVLAAQWGYLPGLIWIVIGACLAGAVHDFVILTASVRQNGLSLPNIARQSIGEVSGHVTSIATLFIIVTTLAAVATVVVNALAESSWGMFTILVTIPAALITGLWMYKIRPGRVTEASIIGVTLVLAGVFFGKPFAESSLGPSLIFAKKTLSILLPFYAVIASILPVWVLMCPRDYLSSYMKIGVMIVLGAGMLVAAPEMKMPATTPWLGGGGPVISGAIWPFVCIVIMCGAISGFHALIASGTTPKMINRESEIRMIGYGAMVLEGFVAITALIAACALEPGDYFAINIAQSTPAQQAAYHSFVANADATHGWNIQPVELTVLETQTAEKLGGRTGGAVTLAVGMAKVFSSLPGMSALVSYWYHFVIMFEALFILTLLETGTRVARFVVQDALAALRGSTDAAPAAAVAVSHDIAYSKTVKASPDWLRNIILSFVMCFAWGYLLYLGNLNRLWSMLGIANQLLASIALAVGTTYLLQHAPRRAYALCTGIPYVFVIITTFTAGVINIRNWWADVAKVPPAEVFLVKLLCGLAAIMLVLTAVIALDAARRWWAILATAPQQRYQLASND
ncbi:MAG: carbon starvation protein A [Phycisphaerales bacterium]|nr:carbon starvation protein A [Phycisphaerales bacterium]